MMSYPFLPNDEPTATELRDMYEKMSNGDLDRLIRDLSEQFVLGGRAAIRRHDLARWVRSQREKMERAN